MKQLTSLLGISILFITGCNPSSTIPPVYGIARTGGNIMPIHPIKPGIMYGINYDWTGNTISPCWDSAAAPMGTATANMLIKCMNGNYQITNWDLQTAAITNQLQQIRNNGITALRVILWFTRSANLHGQNFYGTNLTAADACTSAAPRQWLMDSTGGTFSAACTANIKSFTIAAKAIGFQQIIFAYGPEADNWFFSPGAIGGSTIGTWPAGAWIGVSPYESYYQENLALVKNLQPFFNSVSNDGFQVWNDIHTECVNNGLTISSQYCARLWADYVAVYGKNGTLGFSQIQGTGASTFAVYGGNNPLFGTDVHLYGGTEVPNVGWPTDAATFQSSFTTEYTNDIAAGESGPMWITETLCCSSTIIQGIQAGAAATGAQINWISPWPLMGSGLYVLPNLNIWKPLPIR